MIVRLRMSPEKKEKMMSKIDKMMEFLEDFQTCLEESEDYEEDGYEEEPSYRRRSSGGSMNSRYSMKRRGGM